MERGFRWETCFSKQDSPALETVLCLEMNKSCMNSESDLLISLFWKLPFSTAESIELFYGQKLIYLK